MPLLDDKSLAQDRTQEWVAEPGLVPRLDLDRHSLCGVALGERFEQLHGLGAAQGGSFGGDGDYAWYTRGLHVEVARGRCAAFRIYFVEEEGYLPFAGECVFQGRALALSALTTESDFISRFGAPYWRDEDEDGERVLFYEHARADRGDQVEWQVELDSDGRLACLLLLTPPSLASAAQREAYRVTKPWPF